MLYSRQKKTSPHWVVIRNVALVFICIFLISKVVGLLRTYNRAQERLRNVQTTYDEASRHHQQLQRQYTNLTTEEGLEYYLRDQYRAVAEGEELVVLVDDQQQIAVQTAPAVQQHWFDRVLSWLDSTRK